MTTENAFGLKALCRALTFVALSAALTGLAACGGSAETAETTPPPAPEAQKAPTEGGYVFGPGGWFDFGSSKPATPAPAPAQTAASAPAPSPVSQGPIAAPGSSAAAPVLAPAPQASAAATSVPTPPPGARGTGVNALLWRATLDTLSFMPVGNADPFGGIYATDWFSPATSPSERVKVTVFILDTRLRADAVKVTVFRQSKDNTGLWAEAAVSTETPVKIENAILNRARELRASEE